MENTLALFLFAGWSCLCLSSQLLLFLLWTRDDKILLWDICLWGICRVKHLELLVLPEPEQNPSLKEESLGFGHKNQRPHWNSNGILFSAFLSPWRCAHQDLISPRGLKSLATLTQIQQAYSNQLTSLSTTPDFIYKVNYDPLLHIFQNLVFWLCIESGAREAGRGNGISNA